ncbi:MAG TPA: glutamate racemase [Bdellovibrionales bacterium]|nr:glutamate racemase [Bdellovibrionales bacterium]
MKIGVFDSGLGGLTVVRELRRLCSSEEIIYLGDTARVPYGIRSDQVVQQYVHECATFLLKQQVDIVVVACNTVSAVAIEQLKLDFTVPVFGVIEPGAEEAVRISEGKPIGVLGTFATVESGAYGRAIVKLGSKQVLESQAAPLLAPLVEEGWIAGEVPRQVIRRYLEPLLRKNIRALILGCTHYPLLKELIEAELKQLSKTPVTVVDSGIALAENLRQYIQNGTPGALEEVTGEPITGRGKLSVYVTDTPRRFKTLAEKFLGEQIGNIEAIKLV